jgi:HD domain
MSRAAHLTARFFGSLGARGPDAGDVLWVRLVLTPEEFACWEELGRPDRVESIAVARRVARELGPDADYRWLAAALLHDVGKIDAGLGTFRRAGATTVAAIVSHGRARHWPNRIGRYIAHDDLGAIRLEAAGARPEAIAWATAHHRPETWPPAGIPPEICEILATADGER